MITTVVGKVINLATSFDHLFAACAADSQNILDFPVAALDTLNIPSIINQSDLWRSTAILASNNVSARMRR
jgi:hypothetical protein